MWAIGEEHDVPHSTYLPERMGTAEISPTGAFEAGSFQSFTLVYTAGYFGIDDTGSIKIVHRFASDMGRPESHLAMARRTPWIAEFGGQGSAPTRDPRDRTTRLTGGGGGALRAAQAIPATELRGAGFHLEDSASFRAFPRLPLSWCGSRCCTKRSARSARRVGKRS